MQPGLKRVVDAQRFDMLGYQQVMRNPTGYVAGQVELTSKCEQRCRNCQSWIDHDKGVERGEWDLDDLKAFMLQLGGIDTFRTLAFTGGDPQSWEPLSELLMWYLAMRKIGHIKYRLRMNTALPRFIPEKELPLWREAISDLRVSLDGVIPEYYRKMRGVDRDPTEVFIQMELLNHSALSTLTCVSQTNIDHVPAIVNWLSAYQKGGYPLRKAIFIPVRDMNDRALVQIDLRPDSFWEEWHKLKDMYGPESIRDFSWCSFGENVEDGENAQYKGVTCNVSKITFHVKSNGDLYPCCLMGGEALQTRTSYRLGNVLADGVRRVWRNAVANGPRNVYDDPNGPCARICLWKQSTMNLIGEEAEAVSLAMP